MSSRHLRSDSRDPVFLLIDSRLRGNDATIMIKPGIYEHYKGGQYKVLFIAMNQSNDDHDEQPVVVYEAIYDNPLSQFWVRLEKEFLEEIEFEGARVPRFKFIKDV